MKKLLIIAYHFPPRGGIAVKRTLKFTKTLPQFGWNPIILTTKFNLHEYKILDTSLLSELPQGLKIYRTTHLSKKQGFRGQLRKFFYHQNVDDSPKILQEGFFKKILTLIGSHVWPPIPDVESGWFPFAVMRGGRIIAEDRVDAIYTTSPPHSTHLIGCVLSKRYDKPWLADFRDDWVTNPLFTPKSKLRNRINRMLEEIVVKNASRIVVTNRYTKESFLKKHPTCQENKIMVIPNGYDPHDFNGLQKQLFSKFTIFHGGTFGPGLTVKYFLMALKSLIEEHPTLREEIQVLFVGSPLSRYRETLGEYNLNDIVLTHGQIPYKQNLQLLVKSHLFLIFLTEEAGGKARTPAKIYEYLAVGRPILGMVIEGDTADKIREMNLGSVVSPTDVDGIKKELYRYYQEYQSDNDGYLQSRTSPADIDHYDQVVLTKRLSEHLLGNPK